VPLMSTRVTPAVCTAEREMPSSFLSTRTMCFSRRVRLLLIVIAAGISVSVSAETRKPIYRIRRYCKATSEYSPIRSIGLTLVAGPHIVGGRANNLFSFDSHC